MKNLTQTYALPIQLMLVLVLSTAGPLWGQAPGEDGTVISAPSVQAIRIGAHPEFTRIYLDLDQPVVYQVVPELRKNKVVVFLPGARVLEGLEPRKFPDRNLESIEFMRLQEGVRVTFRLKNPNTRLFHYLKRDPNAVVLDFQVMEKPVARASKASTKKENVGKEPSKPLTTKNSQKNSKKRPRKGAGKKAGKNAPVEMTPEQIQRLVKEDVEKKLIEGWEEYKVALTQYQLRQYPEAIEAFDAFKKKYPRSPLVENILYLKAEALFNIHNPKPFPVYEEVINAYQMAMRGYPKSKFFDHALYKLGVVFDNMDLPLEARTLYLRGVEREEKSLYNNTRRTKLAEMLLREKKYEKAFEAFKGILKTDPKNEKAQKATFQIAQSLYDRDNLPAALKLFEEGASRWPNLLNEVPEINYYMGEIYFHQKQYKKARNHLFHFVNLEPETKRGHQSLNRIGDSYLIANNGLAALSIFDKSQRINPDSAEAQYAKIRLADIGVRDPTLPVQDIVFDIPQYFKPIDTYEEVSSNAKSQDILAEVTLSQGLAHLQQKRYLEAFEGLKKLMTLDPTSRFYKTARNHLEQALVFLIDDYAHQEGHLPLLYAYNQFRNLNRGDVRKSETLLQVGESYQAIGMINEALAFYERVKKSDPNGVYRDRLFLNLGQIHVDQKNFAEAEIVARTFLTSYPFSPQVPDAMKIAAAAFRGQKEYDAALDLYQQLLKRADSNPSEVHYLMAETWFQRDNLEQAIRQYAMTLDKFDRSRDGVREHVKDAYYKLGLALYQSGRYLRALDALVSARRLYPKHSLREWADFLIADCYDRTKKKDRAEQELQKIVESPPDEDLLKQAAEIGVKVLDWEKRLKQQL